MKTLAVRYDNQTPVGTLTIDHTGGVWFQYAPEWLANGLDLSPVYWPLSPVQFSPNREPEMKGLPGFIADSLPDSYGMAVMNEQFRAAGLVNPDALDMLGLVGADGTGILTYHPAASWETAVETVITQRRVAALAREAHLAETGAKLSALLRQEGASLGGARPKMRLCLLPDGSLRGTVNPPDGAGHWILKFDNPKHPGEARVEYAYSLMARAAGIEMPATRLIEGEAADGQPEHHFAIQRFDRAGARGKIHFHSLAGLLNVPIRARHGDYEEILGAVMQLGCPAADVEQVVRRCAFNQLACNRDDHYKNFAFLHHPAGGWRFSPAYDLTYTDPNLRWVREIGRAAKLFGKIDFTADDVARLGRMGNLSASRAKKIIAEVRDAVWSWRQFAELAGVGSRESRRIANEISNTPAR